MLIQLTSTDTAGFPARLPLDEDLELRPGDELVDLVVAQRTSQGADSKAEGALPNAVNIQKAIENGHRNSEFMIYIPINKKKVMFQFANC